MVVFSECWIILTTYKTCFLDLILEGYSELNLCCKEILRWMQKDGCFIVPWIQLGKCQKYILSVASLCWIVRALLFNLLWKWPNPSVLSGNDSLREWYLLNTTVLASRDTADAAVLQLSGLGRAGSSKLGRQEATTGADFPTQKCFRFSCKYFRYPPGVGGVTGVGQNTLDWREMKWEYKQGRKF